MFNENRNSVPFWLIGVFVALALILIGQRFSGPGNPVLVERFAPQPTDPNAPQPAPFELPQVSLPQLPPELQQRVTDLRSRFSGGEAVPALTPQATGVRVRVEVQEVRRTGDTVQVRGSIANISDQPISVPSSAFSFRDSTGVVYAIGGSGSANVQPGQSTSLELEVPVPPARGITMIVSLPPDPPIQQILVLETTP